MSAFLIAAFIMRSVPTRRSSRAFIASFMALLMVSRSTEAPLCAKNRLSTRLFTWVARPLTAAGRRPIYAAYEPQTRRFRLDRAETHGAAGAGGRHRFGGFRPGRHRAGGRRGLLQYRDDRLLGNSNR